MLNRLKAGLTLLILLGMVVGSGQQVAAQTSGVAFKETGQTVRGKFLAYWQQHGGLAQQGYPISGEIEEKSDLNGQTYTVQYFERASFELHPENKAPYDVLLSQLGTFRYRDRYGAAGAPGQRVNPANARLFAETGKQIGGRFRNYWEQHGGLAQQGFPISNEFEEVSPLDGKTYSVQYFERATFELHKENKAPYDVLLSQLGRFRYDAKYKSGPIGSPTGGPTGGPSSSPTSTPAIPGPETTPELPPPGITPPAGGLSVAAPVKVEANTADVVIVGGHYLFWQNPSDVGPAPEVIGYDITSREVFTVTSDSTDRYLVASDGTTLLWMDVGDEPKLVGYDIPSRKVKQLPGAPNDFDQAIMRDGVLYYTKFDVDQLGAGGLFSFTFRDGSSKKLSSQNAEQIALGEGAVLMVSSDGTEDIITSTLRLINTTDGQESVIGQLYGQVSGVALDGKRAVWSSGEKDSKGGVYLYDLVSKQTSKLASGECYSPYLYRNLLAWTSYPTDSSWNLRLLEFSSGTAFTAASGTVDLDTGAGDIFNRGFAGDSLVYTQIVEGQAEGGKSDLFVVKLGAGSASLPAAGVDATQYFVPNQTGNSQGSLVASGGYLAWVEPNDKYSNLNSIFLYKVSTRQLVTLSTTGREYVSMNYPLVMWEDIVSNPCRYCSPAKLMVNDLSTSKVFEVPSEGQMYMHNRYLPPVLVGRSIIWCDTVRKKIIVTSRNIDSGGVEQETVETQMESEYFFDQPPVVGAFYVAWVEVKAYASSGADFKLKVYDRRTGVTTLLMKGLDTGPNLQRGYLIPDGELAGYLDLDTGKHLKVEVKLDGRQVQARGNVLVWLRGDYKKPNIWGYELSGGEAVQLTSAAGGQTNLAVDGDVLAWIQHDLDGGSRIAYTSLSAAFAAAKK